MDAKRIKMREETRRAVSDVAGIILSRYGIVFTFDDVFCMAKSIDREFLVVISRNQSLTPTQREKELANTPEVVE